MRGLRADKPQESEACSECQNPRGAANPASREHLITASHLSDELSLSGASVELADGSHSAPIDVHVHLTTHSIVSVYRADPVALLSFKGESIEIFLDPSHQLFKAYRARPEHAIAMDLGQFLYDSHRSLIKPSLAGMHTLPRLATAVLSLYSDNLEDSVERVRADIYAFLDTLKGRLTSFIDPEDSETIYGNLTEPEQRAMVANIIGAGLDVSQLSLWRTSGEFLLFVAPDTLAKSFARFPHLFFDGQVWNAAYTGIVGLDDSVVAEVQAELVAKYLNCLEDCASYLKYQMPEGLMSLRSRASIDFLTTKLV